MRIDPRSEDRDYCEQLNLAFFGEVKWPLTRRVLPNPGDEAEHVAG